MSGNVALCGALTAFVATRKVSVLLDPMHEYRVPEKLGMTRSLHFREAASASGDRRRAPVSTAASTSQSGEASAAPREMERP